MRNGIRIAIDVGRSRVGVARSDPQGLMAVPVVTLARDEAMTKLLSLAREYDALEFVCGLPIGLDGMETASTADARTFARQLRDESAVPVRLVDERLTTVSAQNALHDASHTVKSGRAMIDQVAATVLLETALAAERAGNTLGEMVEDS